MASVHGICSRGAAGAGLEALGHRLVGLEALALLRPSLALLELLARCAVPVLARVGGARLAAGRLAVGAASFSAFALALALLRALLLALLVQAKWSGLGAPL